MLLQCQTRCLILLGLNLIWIFAGVSSMNLDPNDFNDKDIPKLLNWKGYKKKHNVKEVMEWVDGKNGQPFAVSDTEAQNVLSKKTAKEVIVRPNGKLRIKRVYWRSPKQKVTNKKAELTTENSDIEYPERPHSKSQYQSDLHRDQHNKISHPNIYFTDDVNDPLPNSIIPKSPVNATKSPVMKKTKTQEAKDSKSRDNNRNVLETVNRFSSRFSGNYYSRETISPRYNKITLYAEMSTPITTPGVHHSSEQSDYRKQTDHTVEENEINHHPKPSSKNEPQEPMNQFEERQNINGLKTSEDHKVDNERDESEVEDSESTETGQGITTEDPTSTVNPNKSAYRSRLKIYHRPSYHSENSRDEMKLNQPPEDAFNLIPLDSDVPESDIAEAKRQNLLQCTTPCEVGKHEGGKQEGGKQEGCKADGINISIMLGYPTLPPPTTQCHHKPTPASKKQKKKWKKILGNSGSFPNMPSYPESLDDLNARDDNTPDRKQDDSKVELNSLKKALEKQRPTHESPQELNSRKYDLFEQLPLESIPTENEYVQSNVHKTTNSDRENTYQQPNVSLRNETAPKYFGRYFPWETKNNSDEVIPLDDTTEEASDPRWDYSEAGNYEDVGTNNDKTVIMMEPEEVPFYQFYDTERVNSPVQRVRYKDQKNNTIEQTNDDAWKALDDELSIEMNKRQIDLQQFYDISLKPSRLSQINHEYRRAKAGAKRFTHSLLLSKKNNFINKNY